MDSFQTQAWICPNCFDDHSTYGPCPLFVKVVKSLEYAGGVICGEFCVPSKGHHGVCREVAIVAKEAIQNLKE